MTKLIAVDIEEGERELDFEVDGLRVEVRIPLAVPVTPRVIRLSAAEAEAIARAPQQFNASVVRQPVVRES